MLHRRAFLQGAALASGLAVNPVIAAPRHRRARFGVQTYSFRDMLPTPGDMVDKMIAGCRAVGVDMIELFEPTIQPPVLSKDAPWAFVSGKPTEASLFGRPPEGPSPADVLANREEIRQWRLGTSMATLGAIGRRFARAGIEIQAFNFGLKEDCTDAEVEWGFAATKALNAGAMTASTTLAMARRTVPFAAKYRTFVGLHNHSNLRDPNQLATPRSYEEALAMSPWYRLNLDIGHFAASGFDTLAFLDQHHERTISIHLKDRKANGGMNMPLGLGDTPVADTIRKISGRRWPIAMIVEYEYAGGTSVAELRAMLSYARRFVV